MRSRVSGQRVASACVFAWLLLTVGVVAVSAQADVKVDAKLNADRIAVGESVALQVSIETRGEGADQISTPSIPPGLELTGTHEYSSLQVAYPGGRSRLIRRDHIIRAHLPGEYTIPSFTVTVSGRTHRTRSLSLTVEPRRSSGPGRPGATPGADEVLLRAWLQPDTVFVGQQVTLSAEALFPRDLRQRQSRPAAYEAPTPPNFWIQDIPDAVTTGVRSLNGVPYETQTFRRVYFPLSAGAYALPPARLVYEIRRGFLYAPESRELVSDSMRVVVRAIPEEGRPASYTGAVGRYTVRAKLEPDAVAEGEAATLTVEIEGRGNVKALPAPHLPELNGIEVYPPSEDSRLEASEDQLGGVKRFTWVLVAGSPGRVELPAIEYGFFDPERRQFDVARASPLALRVSAARARLARTGADTALRPLARAPAARPTYWTRSPMFAALQAVPLLALFAALLLNRNGENLRGRRLRRRLRSARAEDFEALRRAAASAESDPVFFSDFAAAIRVALADLLEDTALRTASRETIVWRVRERGASPEAVRALDTLFQSIDHARFARTPATAVERAAMVALAKRVVDQIDQELWPSRSRAPVAGAVLMCCLFVAPQAAHASNDPFAAGVAAYEQQSYAEAAEGFAEYLRGHAYDANGWYNLGNAYLRTGHRGHAVWAWLKTLELQPRHAAARHNLLVADADAALATLPPTFTLSVDEAILAITALWWIGGLTVAVLLAHRRRGAGIIAGVAITLAMTIALLTMPLIMGGPSAVALQESTPLLAGPTPKAEPLASLDAAVPVQILERRGEWWRVRSRDGREGWVESFLFAEV
jgi:hypothetical protein